LLPVAVVGEGAAVGGKEAALVLPCVVVPRRGEEDGNRGAVCEGEWGEKIGVRFLVFALGRVEEGGSVLGAAREVASMREQFA
jgi:hypothetical protein